MLLGPHEKVLRSAYAVLERGPHGRDRPRPGVLYLTTERLVFESPRSRGVVRDLVGGRDVDRVLDLPLAELHNVAVRRGRWSRPRLVLDLGGHREVVDLLAPEEWSAAIGEARRGHAAEPAGVPAAVVPHATRTVVKVRCRYCGGLADEAHNRCPSCGAPL